MRIIKKKKKKKKKNKASFMRKQNFEQEVINKVLQLLVII